MKNGKSTRTFLILVAILGVAAMIGCTPPANGDGDGDGDGGGSDGTALGPAQVVLDTAGNYVILAKTGITLGTLAAGAVKGDIALSPGFTGAITGTATTLVETSAFQTSQEVVGKIYAADMTSTTPAILGAAVLDMEAAKTDAATRPDPPAANIDLAGGSIGGETLAPGFYKWTGNVLITGTNLTIKGDGNDRWIFKIAGTLTVDPGRLVVLSGGALAKNIVWVVEGAVILDTTTQFRGIILAQTGITMNAGATMVGRALAQTAVILNGPATTITAP